MTICQKDINNGHRLTLKSLSTPPPTNFFNGGSFIYSFFHWLIHSIKEIEAFEGPELQTTDTFEKLEVIKVRSLWHISCCTYKHLIRHYIADVPSFMSTIGSLYFWGVSRWAIQLLTLIYDSHAVQIIFHLTKFLRFMKFFSLDYLYVCPWLNLKGKCDDIIHFSVIGELSASSTF